VRRPSSSPSFFLFLVDAVLTPLSRARRALDLARFTVQTFLLHASLVHPLSEAGKLKLTSDTTALEFAISQYLSGHGLALSSMGDQFKALRGASTSSFSFCSSARSKTDLSSPSCPSFSRRPAAAFRPLLFLDLASLADPLQTGDVPTLILVQHLLARANVAALPLPNVLHGRTEAEYVRWLNEHREEERIGMVEGVVRRWEEQGKEGGDEAERVAGLVRKVLERVGPR